MANKISHIFIVFLLFTLYSCDWKRSDNGDLDGNWQLISWADNESGKVIATKESCIYYSINLQLIKFHRPTKLRTYYMATFSHTPDSLFIHKIFASPFDSIVNTTELLTYGVTEDGAFRIGRNNSNELILVNSANTLQFRKK